MSPSKRYMELDKHKQERGPGKEEEAATKQLQGMVTAQETGKGRETFSPETQGGGKGQLMPCFQTLRL